MKANRSNNTRIELLLRRELFRRGIRYRINRKILTTRPDISIAKYKIAVFCDGDFWHGKDYYDGRVKHNKVYWDTKIKRNKERDFEQTILLRDEGWTVLRFWGSEIIDDAAACAQRIIESINQKKLFGKSRYPPIPIVFILKCNSAVIKKLSSLSNVCKKKNGDFIVTPKDDGDIGDFVYEMLTVKPAVFYKSIKPWTHVNVDLD